MRCRRCRGGERRDETKETNQGEDCAQDVGVQFGDVVHDDSLLTFRFVGYGSCLIFSLFADARHSRCLLPSHDRADGARVWCLSDVWRYCQRTLTVKSVCCLAWPGRMMTTCIFHIPAM